jgi:hypothetical protein
MFSSGRQKGDFERISKEAFYDNPIFSRSCMVFPFYEGTEKDME